VARTERVRRRRLLIGWSSGDITRLDGTDVVGFTDDACRNVASRNGGDRASVVGAGDRSCHRGAGDDARSGGSCAAVGGMRSPSRLTG